MSKSIWPPPPIGATARPRSNLKTRARNRLTAGLVLILPIWVTLLLAGFVFRLMRDASLWIVEALLLSPWTAAGLEKIGISASLLHDGGIESLPTVARWTLAGFAVLLTIALIYVLGMITTNIVGKRIVNTVEALVDRVPFVKTIYRACKQMLETFAGESTQSFQRVVSVPFPTRDVRIVGFVTRVAQDPTTREEVCAVFVPTAPNPTTGYMLVMPRSELIDLPWSVEDAVKAIMSGGVLTPDPMVMPAQFAQNERAAARS